MGRTVCLVAVLGGVFVGNGPKSADSANSAPSAGASVSTPVVLLPPATTARRSSPGWLAAEPVSMGRADRTAARLVTLGESRPLHAHDPYVRAERIHEFTFEMAEDRDFDEQPDDWTRRRGPGFPHYVRAGIDRRRGRTGRASLRFDVDGGEAAYYSPQIRIDSVHTFLFEGYVRTQLLEHDAAVITVSLLDHERRRVQRFTSAPVTGTHDGWTRLRIGPMTPRADVRFAVVGCHLVHGAGGRDFHGAVWFDDFWIGRTPRLSLEGNFHTHFIRTGAPIHVRARVGGIAPDAEHTLVLELLDANGDVLAETTRRVVPVDIVSENPGDDEKPIEIEWDLPPRDFGFYHVRAVLERDGEAVLEEATTVAVMKLSTGEIDGQFGWAISSTAVSRVNVDKFVDVVAQAGVHWMKQPVWQLATGGNEGDARRTAKLFEGLRRRHVRIVGVLETPPDSLRRKFASNWSGVSEAFTMAPELWAPSLSPVLARYSAFVRYWQLGGDDDSSFVGLDRLDETLTAVKAEFDRVGKDSRVGVRWTWEAEPPIRAGSGDTFLSILEREPISLDRLGRRLNETRAATASRWVVLKPLARSEHPLRDRAGDLVKRMTVARAGGADAIFAYDVFDPEHGLLNPDGSPTPMFLPWRTTATALSRAEYLGSIELPGGSTNHLFARDGELTMIIWNDTPEAAVLPVVEEFFIGEDAITLDPWGREAPIATDPETRRQRLLVGRGPLVIRGGSEEVARWRMATRFENGRFDSAIGQHAEAVLTRNTFSQGISGKATLVMSREWKAEPMEWTIAAGAGEPIALRTFLELPQNATLGAEPVAIDFEITADRAYKFRVVREFRIGRGDIELVVLDRKLPDGSLEIEQLIVNRTSPVEILNLECSLFVPGMRRRRQLVTKLGSGEDRRFYHLPDAEALRGRELWLRAKQEGGRRVLNYKWTVGENWDRTNDTDGASDRDRPSFE